MGRKYYPVPYEVGKLIVMIGGAVFLYAISVFLKVAETDFGLAINMLFLLGYLALSWVVLRPKFK